MQSSCIVQELDLDLDLLHFMLPGNGSKNKVGFAVKKCHFLAANVDGIDLKCEINRIFRLIYS